MQEILGLVRRCVEDYDMIQSGDTVAVGVSGGKDSLLTLTALARLSRFYPKPFRVVAMTIEAGTPGMSFDGVADYCRALGVEYIRVSVPIYEVVFLERREKNPCSLCAKLRRGALSTAMNEHGIRKIALGHHYDDAVETMLMSLIFEGRLGCFQPVTYLSRTDGERVEKIQSQRKAGDRLGQAEQEQREEAQRRVEQHLRRQPQRCGEQPHHRKKHEGTEDRNAYLICQTHVAAPSE